MRSSLVITSLFLLPLSTFALPISSDAVESGYILDSGLLPEKRGLFSWLSKGDSKTLPETTPEDPVVETGLTTLPPNEWPDPGPGYEYPPADFPMPLDANGIPRRVKEGIPWQLLGYGPSIPRPERYYDGTMDRSQQPTEFDSTGHPFHNKRTLL